jgi:hypothetical protein
MGFSLKMYSNGIFLYQLAFSETEPRHFGCIVFPLVMSSPSRFNPRALPLSSTRSMDD